VHVSLSIGTVLLILPPYPLSSMLSRLTLSNTSRASLLLLFANTLLSRSPLLLVILTLSVRESPPLASLFPPLPLKLSKLDRRRQVFLADYDNQTSASDSDSDSDFDTAPPSSLRRSVRLTATPSSDHCHSHTSHHSEWTASDLTDHFPVPSYLGHEYILITLHRGFIHYHPMKSRSAPAYVSAFKVVLSFFHALGFAVTNLKLDNESSAQLSAFFLLHHVAFQHVPPFTHRANPAERSIRTAKNHLIATLSTTHFSFPANRWNTVLPLAQLTLKSFALDPSKSAWHGIHGRTLDFAAHPIHPAGQLVVAHDPPQARASWARHGTSGFYVAPSLTHYWCHLIFTPISGDTRTSSRIDLLPDPLFTFEDPTIIAPPPDPAASNPDPTTDGTDLVGRSFLDPDLGRCKVLGPGQPHFLHPHTGNLDPDVARLPPG
jgi:hypothetical protein